MEDYKLKYLKYKKKYINLKSKVGGGDMTYEERLAAALALSQYGDNVVPPAAAPAAAEQGWTEDEEIRVALALSKAEDARRQRRAVAPAAAPAVVAAAVAPAAVPVVQGWTEEEQLKAALALSEAEDARRQRSDRGAAAVAAQNAYDLPKLAPYNPISINLAGISQMDFPGSRSACTYISADAAHFILENKRMPTIREYEYIIENGAKNYGNMDGSDFSELIFRDRKFNNYFNLFGQQFGKIENEAAFNEIKEYYEYSKRSTEIICVAITKSPETILICFIPEKGIFLLDSHNVQYLGIYKAYTFQFDTISNLTGFLRKRFPITEGVPQLNQYLLTVVKKKK